MPPSPHPLASRTRCAAALLLLTLASAPAFAAEYSLFDRFSFGVGVSTLGLDTQIRLDSELLGEGVEIDFERDLGLDSSAITPTFHFAWHLGAKHHLYAQYAKADRDATSQVSRELQFGDLVIPIDGLAATAMDLREYLAGYTYYPWVKERWAAGFGLGIRYLDIVTEVRLLEAAGQLPVLEDRADTSGPLPYLNFDYRYALHPKWRLHAGAGWISVKIGDYDGTQLIASLGIEHLVFEHFSWRFSGSIATVDVTVTDPDALGQIKTDVANLGLFVKGRW